MKELSHGLSGGTGQKELLSKAGGTKQIKPHTEAEVNFDLSRGLGKRVCSIRWDVLHVRMTSSLTRRRKEVELKTDCAVYRPFFASLLRRHSSSTFCAFVHPCGEYVILRFSSQHANILERAAPTGTGRTGESKRRIDDEKRGQKKKEKSANERDETPRSIYWSHFTCSVLTL